MLNLLYGLLTNVLMNVFGRKSLLIVILSFCLTIIAGYWYSSQSQVSSSLVGQSDVPSFAIPIDCNLGQDCFVMHYVDIDSSPKAVDFNCGRQTYDGHKGTDFGISSLKVMNAGVSVLAAAEGTVLRVRDGVIDRLVSDRITQKQVAGQECGNGLVIDHGNGWETQYCHLKQGSIQVEPDTKVEQGEVLGMVGSSGLASFPHVHLSIRHQGEIVDPFVGEEAVAQANCKTRRNSLWQESLDYVPTGLIRAGFSTQQPKQTELWQGKYQNNQLSINSPALIFWVHAYGVLKGDREHWQLISPDGDMVIDRENNLDTPYRSWVSYVGKRKLSAGTWQGKYELIRHNQPVFSIEREIQLN